MKLYYKLAVMNALTRILIVLGFIWFVPFLIGKEATKHTDNELKKREVQFYNIAAKIGMNKFIEEESDSTFADYTIFKEKYISIEPTKEMEPDTFLQGRREIEGDTVDARILKHVFTYKNSYYLLEIGESMQYIVDLKIILRKVAIYILLIVILLTVFIDLSFTGYLLRPLVKIENKLRSTIHPERFDYKPLKTSTRDFRYLDKTINDMMHKINNAFHIEKEFIANVSHELLTPISILQTRLENMLEMGTLDEEAETKIIESQITLGRLKQIVKSLLLISQIENNQAPREDRANMSELLEEVVNETEDRLIEKNIQMKVDLKDNYEFYPCNRSLLFTLFFNLVNNAIKYNKENGTVTISTKKINGEFLMVIEDTGKGIAPENLDSIFYRFKKFNATDSESYGLGLSMVKTIADFHGLEVRIESKVGEGTKFTIAIKTN